MTDARVEDDPERCTFEPLDAGVERLMRAAFSDVYAAEIEYQVSHADDIGLGSVAASVEHNGDGESWLMLRATDGTTWYSGWAGNSADAVSLAAEFGLTIAESLSL